MINNPEQQRFYMKHDEVNNILTVEVTEKIAFSIMRQLRIHLWPEVMNMKLEWTEHMNEEGHLYKNVRRYTIPCYADRVDIFFDAYKHHLTKSIQNSIVNSDN